MKYNECKTKLYKRKEIEYFFIDIYIKLSQIFGQIFKNCKR